MPSAPLLSVPDADRRLASCIQNFPTERVPLAAAAGRILAAPLAADRPFPPCARVTMDGYAVDAATARPGARLRVVGLAPAGAPPPPLPAAPAPGEAPAIEVMTGAPLPAGADAVVPYEETQRVGACIQLSPTLAPVAPGACVHASGSDFPAGAVLVPAGVRLTGRELAVAAAIGAAEVLVAARPRLALLSTGDELVPVEAPAPAPWQVRRSNDVALRAALQAAGYPDVACGIAPDDRSALAEALAAALASCSVLILTGGISQGKFDLLPEQLAAAGVTLLFRGVAQRPGKPFAFGLSARGVPVFALPGNPVSAFTCCHRYVLPALDRASGLAVPPPARLALSVAVPCHSTLTLFLPARQLADPADPARWLALPCPVNTSGDFAHLVGTDGFLELPPAPTPCRAGTPVTFHAWR